MSPPPSSSTAGADACTRSPRPAPEPRVVRLSKFDGARSEYTVSAAALVISGDCANNRDRLLAGERLETAFAFYELENPL